jgi:hypothetical protein
MVSTPSLKAELAARGFEHLGLWTRGVNTDLFRPERAINLDLPRPIFVSMGRVAVEKNLEAFLSLDLPGSKVVIGEGPQLAELRHRFPTVIFRGELHGETLAAHLGAADVCLGALDVSRAACRAFALTRSWQVSARQFLGHAESIVLPVRKPQLAYT